MCFWFYVYLSLALSACYHWWICLLVWLLSTFFKKLFSPFFSFCECVCVCVWVGVCFFEWFCLFRFAFTICNRVLSFFFKVFVVGVFFLFFLFTSVCVCVRLFVWFCLFSFAFTIWFEVLSVHFYVCLFVCFFLPFLLSCAAGRVSVLRPGVGTEPPRWESRVQDIGPPETSQPHIISISESSSRDLRLNTKTQLHPMASKLQCWMPHAKQQATKQEHNPTH